MQVTGQSEKGAQPCLISIIRQIARSIRSGCGLAHDEYFSEDRDKSGVPYVATSYVIGTMLGLLWCFAFVTL